ncbi:hypothetical protein F5Y13DRAFT_194488 [Hypoxylon sp. FL1857]|nr:hypothetical protein F5Y13DRAFT_194488 [Hypoxylon sp. FL1857]
MEQMAAQAQAPHFEPSPVSLDSNTNPQVAIYNEDDLSHLLYVNHLHHAGHKDKVIINHVYRDGYSTPLESLPSGTQTPESESNETPVLSDCESDEEGVCLPTSPKYSRMNPLRFEDGFEFPVFLGRQAEEPSHQPSLHRSEPVSKARPDSKHVRIAAPEESHVSEISGPLMSWWPEPLEMMEHEWIDEKLADGKSSKMMPADRHVSNIEGPLMSWWPTPMGLLEHEWDERFYE